MATINPAIAIAMALQQLRLQQLNCNFQQIFIQTQIRNLIFHFFNNC
ncbi:unnamed protein product [Paramecium sonneborni]|uniref:Uncharacterized protein n=1 Tax=Paramecium sonneborni TaxID=65129 RepID=A0A8S1JXL3_9CILI|nr:unnamed protein product [Paramecium sonneborni]